jgi:hypothetical protein
VAALGHGGLAGLAGAGVDRDQLAAADGQHPQRPLGQLAGHGQLAVGQVDRAGAGHVAAAGVEAAQRALGGVEDGDALADPADVDDVAVAAGVDLGRHLVAVDHGDRAVVERQDQAALGDQAAAGRGVQVDLAALLERGGVELLDHAVGRDHEGGVVADDQLALGLDLGAPAQVGDVDAADPAVRLDQHRALGLVDDQVVGHRPQVDAGVDAAGLAVDADDVAGGVATQPGGAVEQADLGGVGARAQHHGRGGRGQRDHHAGSDGPASGRAENLHCQGPRRDSSLNSAVPRSRRPSRDGGSPAPPRRRNIR